jgi:NTE family protein
MPIKPKSFALALGAGGARALAQVAVVEALDELELRPVTIAGSSFGALIGAAYAAGMTGKAIRRHIIGLAHDRGGIFSRLMAARAAPLSQWIAAPLGNPILMDAAKFCGAFLPGAVPEDFAALAIPLKIVATDLKARREIVLDAGPLKPAVAASMAIPGLIRPMEVEGRVLVDGAAVNPLPFDCLRGLADVVVAVDCGGTPLEAAGGADESSGGTADASAVPDPWEAMFAALAVMGDTIVAEKLKAGGPDLVIRPNVGIFRLLDFFQASAILRAADAVKAEVKQRLTALLR